MYYQNVLKKIIFIELLDFHLRHRSKLSFTLSYEINRLVSFSFLYFNHCISLTGLKKNCRVDDHFFFNKWECFVSQIAWFHECFRSQIQIDSL